jgi:hypothetical protein
MTTDEFSTCFACAQGFPAECIDPEEGPEGFIIPCSVRYAVASVTHRGEGGMAPEDITDATSTGRKRAASMNPILSGMVCEWAGLKYAGGGSVPMVGCAGNLVTQTKGGDPVNGYMQGDLHHGPDKNTINNAPLTNLHRICKLDHNRWHALNDPFYAKRESAAKPFLPVHPYYLHDANSEATLEEQEAVEAWWNTPKATRPDYPVEVVGLRQILP